MGEYFGILHALDDLGSPWLIASSIRPQFWYDCGVSQVVVEVVVVVVVTDVVVFVTS